MRARAANVDSSVVVNRSRATDALHSSRAVATTASGSALAEVEQKLGVDAARTNGDGHLLQRYAAVGEVEEGHAASSP